MLIFLNLIIFQSVAKKNYLPPELIPRLKDQSISTENCENVEEIANDLVEIVKKPIKSDVNNDVEDISNSGVKNLKEIVVLFILNLYSYNL